jgi:flavodoxin
MGTTGKTKTLIVYKSVHHQNTARIAHAISEVLRADCAGPSECPYDKLASYDVLGLGSGVYYGGVHGELIDWVRGLPEEHAGHLRVFVFTTSGLPVLAKLWTSSLKANLTKKGYEVLGEFSCRGFDTWGPLWLTGGLNRKHPDERDMQRARGFAAKIGSM